VLSGSQLRIHAGLAIGLILLSVTSAGAMRAQGEVTLTSSRAKPLPRVIQVLDTWVITRFRDARLLPDSAGSTRTSARDAHRPRVESVGDAVSGDTIYALHFGDRRDLPALRLGAPARLTAPSGSITAINADVVARRAFRAPRVPGADTSSAAGWRFGWAYLAIVRPPHASASASVYRGWLLLNAADSSTRR
jgi:hypothetical protein